MLVDRRSGGVLVDIGIHWFDLLRWYLADEPTGVAARHGTLRFTHLPSFTDHGHALVHFPGGAVGYVAVDWLTPEAAPYHGDYRLFVTGTRGYCELRSANPVSLTLVTDDRPPSPIPLPAAGPTASQDFLTAIAEGRAPSITAEDILRSSALALAARLAAESGVEVSLRDAETASPRKAPALV
jgi:predicted dehydrogenase